MDEFKCYVCNENLGADAVIATDHLKSHSKKDGDVLPCIRIQENNFFCNAEFTTHKSLRKHLRANNCRLLSTDTNFSFEEWVSVLDDFDELNVEREEKEKNSSELGTFIDNHVHRLTISHMQQDVLNDVINFSIDLVSKITEMNKKSMKNIKSTEEAEFILHSNEKMATSYLSQYATGYKRNKKFMFSPLYVAPQTISINDGDSFQYVSILDTLKNLFKSKSFRDTYFNYNENHECRENIYERYCCAQNFKKNILFQSNENSIQIQIYYDDVQLTSPLKTKPHKICAIYCIIRNLPPEYVSRLDNMYLIALCDSVIVDKHGYNAILQPFVDEMKILENDGILIDSSFGEEKNIDTNSKIILKGTLTQVTFDNLGGNTIFGLVKCFTSMYYCRICLCDKYMCGVNTTEALESIRTMQHYFDQVKKLRDSRDIVLKPKDTFGITSYSVLNDLNFYHTINNRSQDIMHDVYEGAMPFALKSFFNHLIEHKICTREEFEIKIQTFNYGRLERKNVPSKLKLGKENLNQNASQMHCLMRHFPFIFAYTLQLKDKSKRAIVHKAWPIIEYLLKIDQIICSTVIKESDLTDLENNIDTFLTKVKDLFNCEFKPKLHFLTHYSNTIRIMGPIKYLEMMRGDAKHQPLTQYAKRCRNYTNICKSLAKKHQQVLASKSIENTYKDKIEISKKTYKVLKKGNELIKDMENHSKLIYDHFVNIDRVIMLNFVIINSHTFAKGLFIVFSGEMHEVNAVLKYNDSFIFLCTKFNTVKFYKFSNSFEIKKSTQTLLIAFDKLVCKRSYETKILNEKTLIIADDVDLLPIYENYIV